MPERKTVTPNPQALKPKSPRRPSSLRHQLPVIAAIVGAFGLGYGVRAQSESDWVPPQPLAIFQLFNTPDGHKIGGLLQPAYASPNGPSARVAETSPHSATPTSITTWAHAKVAPTDTKPYQTLEEVRRAIRDNFVKTQVSDEELTYGAIRGMLRSLGDKFTRFMTPEEYADFKEKNEGSFVGIGARIDVKDDYIGGPQSKPDGASRPYIVEPMPGSPALKAGLKAGDVILAVNGKSTADRTIDAVVNDIKGVRGSNVMVQLERKVKNAPLNRDSVYQILNLNIRRDVIEMHPVTLEWLPDNIAWLKLEEFNEKSDPEMTRALQQVRSGVNGRGPARGLVFDMRDNPGGLLDSAVAIGSRFISNGPVVITRERDGREYPMNADPKRFLNLKIPVVVLIDNYSASAAEVVTGAMKDRGVATVVGETSYGKASVQVLLELRNRGALVITTAKYLTPSKHDITEKGITPDVIVKADDEDTKTGRGAQLNRALQIIRQKNGRANTVAKASPTFYVRSPQPSTR